LRVTREFMTTRWRAAEGDVSDVRVWLEGEPGAATLAVIFRHRDRPGCMFGARHFPVEDLVTPADPRPTPTVIWANIDEDIDAVATGLPAGCHPGEVTWL